MVVMVLNQDIAAGRSRLHNITVQTWTCYNSVDTTVVSSIVVLWLLLFSTDVVRMGHM
jgi:hypothetical protein